jgi:hypothetical protein
MEIQDYINTVKIKLATSRIIIKIAIVEEKILLDRGYFRARLTLVNNDFLEIAALASLLWSQLKSPKFNADKFKP